jgi:hypothetical protein
VRIPSGVVDQYVYFVGVDATDFATRETGLATFTVYRSRNGGAAAAMTTPTINETDGTNMPGVYELLLDEDMTIDAGDDSQEMVFHITHAGMAPVTRTIELYRPKITVGETSTAQTGDSFARLGAPAGASVSADVAAVKVDTAAILVDTGTTLDAKIDTIDSIVDAILLDTAEIGAAGAGLTALATAANLATVAGYIDTEVAAIKAKTDNLPASPAAVSDIPTATENADALLNRDMSAVSDTNARTPLNALRLLRNKWTSAAGTLTVTKEDDTTSAWTAALSGDADADPVVGSDPA